MNTSEDTLLELKYQLEASYSKVDLTIIFVLYRHLCDTLYLKVGKLEKELAALKTSAFNLETDNIELHTMNEIRETQVVDHQEENQRLKDGGRESIEKESVEKELRLKEENEKKRKLDQEKIEQLEMMLEERISAFQRAAREHEKEREDLKMIIKDKDQELSQQAPRKHEHKDKNEMKSIPTEDKSGFKLEGVLQEGDETYNSELEKSLKEKDLMITQLGAKLWLQNEYHEKEQEESKKLIKQKIQQLTKLEAKISLQKVHHKKAKEELRKSMKEKEKKLTISLAQSRECYESLQKLNDKLKASSEKKVEQLQTALVQSKREYEDSEELKRLLAEKEHLLLVQREEHEMATKEIEEKVKAAEEEMSRLREERMASDKERAEEKVFFRQELNKANILVEQQKERVRELCNNAESEMNRNCSETILPIEEERARTSFIQVEQLMQHNKTLKSQNEAMKRELETIEDTLNEGFRETQIISKKYAALKSKYSRIEKILRTT